MEFGISFGALYADPQTYLKFAKEGEEGGYSYLFYPDSQLVYRDPFTNMAAAAMVTKRVKLGTLVSPVVTRDPTVLANAIYTLHELSGGRAVLGIGTGDSSVRRIGKKPATLKTLMKEVEYIKKLTQGERFNFGTGEFGMRFAKEGVPIYTIATGPNMLRTSGKIGDGAIVMVGPALSDWAVEQVKQGAREAGRDPDKLNILWCGFCSIHEDRNVAKARVKPSVSWYCVNFPQLIEKTGVPFGKDLWLKIKEFRANYARYDLVHSDTWEQSIRDAYFIPDELVDKMVLAGTPEDVAKTVGDIQRKGFKTLLFRPPSTDDWYRVFRLFADHVIPKFE
jgi:5,10-methylenetetrahydromethanopterin reductase